VAVLAILVSGVTSPAAGAATGSQKSGGPVGLLASAPLGQRDVAVPSGSYGKVAWGNSSGNAAPLAAPSTSCPWPPTADSPPSSLISPADAAVVATTTPLLSAVALFDPPGSSTYASGCYPLAYDFKVMTAAGGGETVADSGWLYDPMTPSNINNWAVPQGALRDGETYYVTVQTDDTELILTPRPATTITHFTVKLRKGAGGPSPTDTVGSTSSGTTTPAQGSPSPGLAPASETVNLLTGDLALTAGTHSLKTLSGAAAVSLNYNSLDADMYGLAAHYFVDTGDHSYSAGDTLIGQKTDPMVDFNWGIPPIGALPLSGATGFLVRWAGTIYIPNGSTTTPAGNWKFGVQAGGGMRVCFDQSGTCTAANATVDSWTAGASQSTPVFGATLSSVTPGPHAITVEAWVPTGPAVPTVLWLQNLTSGASNPNPFIVPSSWLSSTPASLPAGWSLSGGSYNSAWTGLVDEGSQVVLTASDGSTADFAGSGTGSTETFQPPPGDTDLLSRNPDGTLQLATRAGDVYTFTANGLVSSITTAEDATATSGANPAALHYTYSGDPLQLTAITDPVSGRSITLSYNGNGTCPATTSTGVPLAAPVDMLCAISYWDATQTTFAYNTQGELAEVDNPGGVSRFAYDGAGRLDDLQDPLAYAAVQAGQRSDCPANASSTPTCDTTIGYLTAAATCAASFTPACAQVATVTQPAPTVGAAQPGRSYCYPDSPPTSSCTPSPSTTTVSVAGFSPASGYATKAVYNATGEIISQAGPTGAATTTTWDTAERPVTSVNPAGLQTTTVYDNNSNVIDSYGPAPTACFATTAPYLPLANLSGCGVSAVPPTHNGYDEGITGPNTSLWSNNSLSGPPCQDTTGLGSDTSLTHVWGSTVPACASTGGAWSLGLTGLINLPATGTWTFQLASQSNLTVSIDGAPLGQATGNGSWGSTTTATLNVTSPGWHQIDLNYLPIQNPTGGESNGYSLSDQPPGGTMAVIPYSAIDPGYGLKTSTTDPDGKVTIVTYSDPANGIDPIDGLATQTIQDPSTATVSAAGFPAGLGDPNGLSLTTQTGYEPPSPGAYFRKTSSTLPAGNQTTYTYYSGTAGPQAAVCGVTATTPQGGLIQQQTDPAVSAVSRVQQFLYDAAGRQVGARVGSTATIASAGWQCNSYDSTGRLTSQSWPANGSASARTATYTYAVGANPLVNSVSDPAGTVTATVDLLGRVVAYTDANGKTTTTIYAQDGQVQTSTGPQGSLTTGYDPNSGQPTTTALNGTTLATAYYDRAQRMASVSYANGTAASVGYDNYGNQTTLDYTNAASGTLLDGQQTVKSPAGRITSTSFDPAANYVPITATRIADTRTGSGQPYAGQHLGAGATLNVQITGANGDGVPATATAVVVSVMALNATSPTSLVVYPSGAPRPATTTVAVTGSSQVIDNQVASPLGAGGQIAIYNATGTTDVVVDVEGYDTPAPSGSAYQTVSPARICNTRKSAPANQCNGNGTLSGTLQPASTTAIQVTGNGGVPAGATAAVVEFGTSAANPGGALTAYADGGARPATTNLNYPGAGSGPAVSSWAANREDLFVHGADNAIWHKSWNGSTWSAWESLGPTIVSNPAAVARTTNAIDVFGLGSDGNIYQKSWNGTAWSAWASDGAPSAGIAAGSAPAVSSWNASREDLFVRGADNAIWHKYWNGAAWSAWVSLGSTTVSNPAAVSQPGTTTIDLYGTGIDGAVYQKAWDGSAWTAWTSVGAPTPGIAAGSAPATSAWSSQEDLFVRGADNAIWHKFRTGTTWSGWVNLGPTIVSSPAAVASPGTTTIDLYGTGTDNNTYKKSYSGGWTAWASTGAPSAKIAADSLGTGVVKEAVVPLASNGRFDLYNAAGTTDLTVDVVGYYSPTAANQYFPVAATRIADTRTGSGKPLAGQTLGPNSTLTVPVVGANGDQVPANATAIVVNITDPDATANSTFTAYPTGAAQPATTNLSFGPGQTATNQATVGIGTSGSINIYNTTGTADLTVDVEGYLAPATSTATASYTYDGTGRLTQTVTPTNTTSYGYAPTTGCPDNNAGANTNRTSLTTTGTGAGTTSYCYNNADQLTSATLNSGNPNTSYNYDPQGNQTNDGGTTLTWDSANRLATTTNPAGTLTAYTYDPLDRVIQQQDGTTTTRYSYPGMTTALVAILDTNNNLIDSIVSLPGGVTVTVPAVGLASSTWSYTNLQGDTTLTATDTGAPQGNPVVYDPWGVPAPGSNPIANTPAGSPTLAAYGAAGKLTDPNNNLITMGARPFNPAEARFVTVDPIQGGCANPYTYAFGDPLNFPDLSGKAGCDYSHPYLKYFGSWTEQGDAKITVPTGQEIAVTITDVSYYPGGFTVSDQWGETHSFTSLGAGNLPYFGDPAIFKPAFGQDSYDLDVKWNPLPIAKIDDYPDATYAVNVYIVTYNCWTS
jgi:RHS repeat-associated protein